MIKNIVSQRVNSRRRIASLEGELHGTSGQRRASILSEIAIEREFLSYSLDGVSDASDLAAAVSSGRCRMIPRMQTLLAELMPGLPGAPEQYVYPDSMPTFSRLMDVLEQDTQSELNSLQLDRNPSDTDIERWALHAAVLEYYKLLGVDFEEVVVESYGDDLMRRDLAPNQEDIYIIWLRRLEEQTRSDDKHRLSMDKYDEAVNRGFGRGTAFEKQLDRYREDFMQKLWQKHNEEVDDAR